MECNGIDKIVHGRICLHNQEKLFLLDYLCTLQSIASFHTSGMKVLNHAYIFEEKIYIQPYFFVLLLQSMQLALIAVLQKSYVSAKCKLQQLQTAKGVVYCSFSYSPRFTFLIILFVARLTKEYITDLSDNPTSFPA